MGIFNHEKVFIIGLYSNAYHTFYSFEKQILIRHHHQQTQSNT